jgi:hypothetical protein
MKKKKTVKGNQSRPEVINFVCKYDLKFNHARVYDDRKRKMKAGYCKHKNGIMPGDGDIPGFFCVLGMFYIYRVKVLNMTAGGKC